MPRLIIAEPAAAYLRRSPIVVDASILAAVLFSESGRGKAEASMAGHALCAPSLIDFEIANVALNKKRRRLIDADTLEGAIRDFTELDIERYPITAADLVALAERYALSAYDASYLWLAASLQVPLVTFDERLGAAAKEHLAEGDRPGQ